MSQHLEATTIQVTPKGHPPVVGTTIVDHRVTGQVDDRLPLVVVNSPAGVAEIPVHFPIRAKQERVRRVIVLGLAGLGKEDLLAIGLVVSVNVGEDQHVGRTRHDDAVAQHANAHRAVHIAALVENRLLVAAAVAVGVLENQDPVTGLATSTILAVVDHLAHPHPPTRINVDIRQAGDGRLGSKQGRLHPRGHIQAGHRVLRSPNVAGLGLGPRGSGLSQQGQEQHKGR